MKTIAVPRALVVIALVSCTASPCLAADSAAKVLAQLRKELHLVRGASGDKPVTSAFQPNPTPLVGLTQREVQESLEEPNHCQVSACVGPGEWVYWFFWLPPGWRGGGPELVLDFDGIPLRVKRATWRFSR
jgi:hypothetical protein